MAMARFPETLWFKKGTEAPSTDAPPVGDTERPIEDRYVDDGSLSKHDRAAFSVVTGTTQPLRMISLPAPPADDATMQLMVEQMKRGRMKVYAALGASMACIMLVVAMFVA